MAVNELPLIEAALIAVNEINERGGLLGREVRAFVADGLSKPEFFEEEARNLIRGKGICSLFGCWTSSSRKAVKQAVEREDSLLWYPVQYEGLEQSPNIVYTGSCMNQQIAPAVDWALSMGRRRIALVGSDYVFPRTANKLVTSMLAATDASVAYESYHPLDCQDFSTILEPLRDSGPDLILNTINGQGNIPFLEQLHGVPELGRPDLVCSLSCSENLFSRLSHGAEGQLACWGYFQSIDAPSNKHFLAKLDRANIQVSSDPIATAYSQVLLWASIVERIGSCAPADIRANLVGAAIDSPLGRLEIQANQHVLRNGYIGRCDARGQFDVIWQSEAPIAPLPWLGVENAELPFKELIIQVLSQLPEDISIHARLEEEVAARNKIAAAMEKNQRRLLESEAIARVGGFERDFKTGDGYWSDTLFDILGYPPGAFVPTLEAFERHVTEEDRQGVHYAFLESVAKIKELDHQCRIRRADGAVRHVRIHNVIIRNEKGQADHYHGTVMDITEQVMAEEALKASEEKMRLLAQTDELTGMLNRRRFLELAAKEIKRALRYQTPFSLIMFDVDKFKTVNDTYGHAVGDLVLKAIACCAKEISRDVDVLGRIGGEEFALALPQTSVPGAKTVAERLRKTVEDRQIVVNDATLRCAISLGVAELSGCVQTIDRLLKAADLALYRAKEGGRNRVEIMVSDDYEAACAEIDDAR